jgi:hypothetical protein
VARQVLAGVLGVAAAGLGLGVWAIGPAGANPGWAVQETSEPPPPEGTRGEFNPVSYCYTAR